VIFVVGRNQTMTSFFGDATRIGAVTNAIQSVIAGIPSAVNYGYQEYPARTGCTTSNSCCISNENSFRAGQLNDMSRSLSCDPGTNVSCVAMTDGRPIGPALTKTSELLSSSAANPTNERYAILIADGPPGCPGDNAVDACNNAVTSINDLGQSAKVKVAVVALGDDASSNSCLKSMAQAGGYFDLKPIRAVDLTGLKASLSQIVGNAAKDYCTIHLDFDASTPLMIRAHGNLISYDVYDKNGWDFDPMGQYRWIQVYGDACRLLQSATRKEIEIKTCPWPTGP